MFFTTAEIQAGLFPLFYTLTYCEDKIENFGLNNFQ